MKSLLSKQSLKKLGGILFLTALVELMTGGPGQQLTPNLGLKLSFGERVSYFGLFVTQRWLVFLTLGLIIFVLSSVTWRNGSPVKYVRGTVSGFSKYVPRNKYARALFIVALVVLVFLMPTFVSNAYWRAAMVEQVAIYVLLALGLNVVVGFAGLLDLGFVAFYAIGTYTTAWITGSLPLAPPFHHALNPFWAIPIAIAIAMASGILLGAPTLRLRGDYLAIVTLGFGEIIAVLANNLFSVTGGATGTNQIPHFSFHVGPFSYLWGLDPVPYYYLVIGFTILFFIAFHFLNESRIGRSWTAIREDEVAAESIGINPLKFKVMAFAIGAASAGFAGVITAGQNNFVTPDMFTLQFSINVLVLVIFGGMGSITGVSLGAVVVQVVTMQLDHNPPSGFIPQDLFMYLGALLVVMMIFRPAGLFPAKRRHREFGQASQGIGHGNEVLMGETNE